MTSTKQTNVQYIKVTSEHDDQRIDNFLFTILKGVPKSHVYRILRSGEARVNKKRIKPHYRLNVDDEIRLPPIRQADQSQKPKPSQQSQDYLKNHVIYEDQNILVFNKPSGLAVHGGSGISLGLIEIAKSLYPKYPALELAHRLDRETSGCLILAKKRSVLKELHRLFREGLIKKRYYALVKGAVKEKRTISESLQKNQLQSGERMVRVTKEGKASFTTITPIQSFPTATLIDIEIATGRTHQIRVHCAHVGHPIAGDSKYGDKAFNRFMKIKGLNRLFLHAYSLSIPLGNLPPIEVVSEMADDLEKIL